MKEVVYGSQLGFYLEIKPRRKEQDTEKVKEVIEKYSKKNKDPMYILKKIAKALKREKLTGCTVIAQGAVLTAPGCGKVDAVMNDFSGFQSMNETEDIAIKAVLRPLKDFNPKNDEYIMKYTPQSFSPVLDKIQAMYVEMKGLQGKLMQFDAKNAADEDKQEKLYSTVSSVGFEIAVALADLTFQKGPEQFASAVDKYGPHELGYYEEQYQQLINKDVTRKRVINISYFIESFHVIRDRGSRGGSHPHPLSPAPMSFLPICKFVSIVSQRLKLHAVPQEISTPPPFSR